jgi:hypothetical protein
MNYEAQFLINSMLKDEIEKKKKRETIWVKLSNLQLGSWDYNLIKSRLKKIKKLNLNKPNIKGYNWNEKKNID